MLSSESNFRPMNRMRMRWGVAAFILGLPALSLAMAGDHVTIPGAEEDPTSNVSAAGQADVQLELKLDPVQPNGVWLWAAVDNLRISALTAVEIAESMTASRPTGKIQ